jgi:hypothetical protein
VRHRHGDDTCAEIVDEDGTAGAQLERQLAEEADRHEHGRGSIEP